ncbi:MAG: pentapeptide repeat-containing protein [Leptolyngbya sp. SIO1D8]|nr:pentapeptide repeat-containing protein [Leptolyngbya sp. SIO1D8]
MTGWAERIPNPNDSASASEHREELSTDDRLYLIQTLNALPKAQFDELIFVLKPPVSNLPDSSAPRGDRSIRLLEWAESRIGPGLVELALVLECIIATHSKQTKHFMAIVLKGEISVATQFEVEAFVQYLRARTGDESVTVEFLTKGSIKIILSGSPEGLQRLQDLFESGELRNLETPLVEDVRRIGKNTLDVRKAQFIQALRLHQQPLIKAIHHALALAHGLDNALVSLRHIPGLTLNQEGDPSRALDLARQLDLNLTHALELIPAHNSLADLFDFGRSSSRPTLIDALNSAREHTNNIIRNLLNNLNSSDRDLLTGARAWADTNPDTLNSLSSFERDLISTLSHALGRALELTHDHDLDIDLRNVDLSGANLRGIDLRGVNLEGTDLTNADVIGTIFGENPGLTTSDKRDLQRRGAIFQDPPSMLGLMLR